jgi:hypothetical protein
MSDARTEILLRQALTAPSSRGQLAAVDALIAVLQSKLSGADYTDVITTLLSVVNPQAASS